MEHQSGAQIIALHLAKISGGAEFYPQCIQVEVKGTGNLVPPSEGIVHFPGAYRANDAGIAVDVSTNETSWSASIDGGCRQIYTAPDNDENGYNVKKFYKFPGGPVPKLTPDSGDSGSSATLSASASDGPSSTGLPSATSSSEDATSSSSLAATQSDTDSFQAMTSETPASATAAASGTCHAKRGSIKRRRI